MCLLHGAGGKAELPEGAAGRFIESCYSMLASRFDPTLGGFGAAPKFPRPAEINLLLVEHLRASQDREASSATASSSGAAPSINGGILINQEIARFIKRRERQKLRKTCLVKSLCKLSCGALRRYIGTCTTGHPRGTP